MKIKHSDRNIVDQAIFRSIVEELFNFSSEQRGYDVLDIVLRISRNTPDYSLGYLELPLAEGCDLKTVGDVANHVELALKYGRSALSGYLSLLQDNEFLTEPKYGFENDACRVTELGTLCGITSPFKFYTLPGEAFSGVFDVVNKRRPNKLQLALEEDIASIEASSLTMTIDGVKVVECDCLDSNASEWNFVLKDGEQHRAFAEDWLECSISQSSSGGVVVEFPIFTLRVS